MHCWHQLARYLPHLHHCTVIALGGLQLHIHWLDLHITEHPQLHAACTSGATTWTTALLIIRLSTSPTPMGLTPGALSRTINRHANRAPMLARSIAMELTFLATSLMASQKSPDDLPNEQQACFHAAESIPDGPAAPFTFMHGHWLDDITVNPFINYRMGITCVCSGCDHLISDGLGWWMQLL